jgi:hypothetical protein
VYIYAPFLRFYLHLRTVCAFLRNKKRTFVYQIKVRFFIFSAHFRAKQGKIKDKQAKITRYSGHRDCRNVIFMPAAAQKSTLLFVVLCSNKEQQKYCIVRELN